MRAKSILIVLAVLIALPLVATAADREAKMIDMASVEFLSYRDMSVPLFTVSGEMDIFDESQIGLIVRGGVGIASYSGSDDPVYWTVSGTLRKRISPVHSITFGAEYEVVEDGEAHRVLAGVFGFHARLRPAEAPVSSFFDLELGVQGARTTDWSTGTDSFTALMVGATIGCDYDLRRDVALVVSLSFRDTSGFGDGPYGGYADGWSANVGFKYYYF